MSRWDQRAKKAILLAFTVLLMRESGTGEFAYADHVPLKIRFGGGVRVVPGAVIRWGASGTRNSTDASFAYIGSYIGAGTLVDTWATVGTCAQVGRNVPISGGVGLGGVLESARAAVTAAYLHHRR